MPGGLIGALGSLFRQRYGAPKIEDVRGPAAPAPSDSTLSQQGAQWPQTPTAPGGASTSKTEASGSSTSAGSVASSSPVAEFNDPIVASLNQQLAQEHPRIPTEDEQLQQEQHAAWGNYDFERCIVIFSRLRELHPDDPNWADKLKVSYFNRGKQYESEGNEQRAIACYYSALSIDSDFPEAQEAAQALVDRAN